MNTDHTKWVAGWGAAESVTAQCHADFLENQTVRYIIFPTLNGSAVRLHFSNRFNEEPTTISKAYVSLSGADATIVPGSTVKVTFGGYDSVTMPVGGSAVSDDIPFEITAGREFAVSLYFGGRTQLMTGHSNGGPYIRKYFCKGDYAAADDFPLEVYGEGGPYLFLNTIDFLTTADSRAIVAFGDSITAQPWPDCLAHRIYDMGITNRAVIRKAIGGGRVLRDYKWRIKKHWGVAGIKRFERDITQEGVDRVFILHGINDLIHPGVTSKYCPMSELPSFEDMVEGYKYYITTAKKHGMKIYLATILPAPRCLADDGIREKIRCLINEWIRTNPDIDGVIDFEAAVRDPQIPTQMIKEYDSGDHLHPSFAGAQHMAVSIPEEFFKN